AGVWVTSDNASDLSVIDGVTGTASFDGTTNTLNLEDATITGGYGTEELGGAVVYTGADPFHIIASGTNTITGDERTYYSAGIYIGNPEDQNNSAGLDCDFDLILADGSVLNVSGGPAKGYTYSASHGIGQFTYGGFAVSGAGTLNANGTDAPYTYGILTNGVWGGTKEFAISEGVTVNATAGETQSGSIGIATGYLLLNVTGNSSITAFAGSADAYSYGIEAFAPVTIDTTGTVTASGNDARIHEWAGSYGINAPYGITINKGTVTATAASAGVEENYSYGIRSNNGKIMINGGTVTALTTSKIGSYAALNYPPILGEGLIAGGSVNADGKNAVAYNAEDNATYTWFRTPFVQYKVTFDMQGHGAAIDTQDVTAGYKAERPEDPTEEGYTFKGWYLNDTEYDFETPVTSDLTLKAKWEPVYHYLTFTVDGENYANMMVEYGYPAMPLDDPVKEGYTFIGWYEGDTKFDFDTPIKKDYDLEARWEKNPEPAPTHDVIRLSGKTRYETSLKAADELKLILGTDKFDNIVLATGKDFADALGGGYLAARKNAPILLTNDKNAAAVNEYINANLKDGGTVYVLGGEGAVSEAALAGINGKVERLSGKSRYETNLAILNEAGVTTEDILICSGTNFADALAASASGRPMLLVNTKKNALTDGQKEFLSAHTSNKLYILGGTGAVSDILEEAVKAYGTPQRVYGSSRYETSVEIAKAFFADPSMAVVASAQTFPDGLCAGPLGYALKAPILLVKDGREVPASSYCVENDITDGYIVGGAGAVSDVAASVVFHLPGDVTIIVK
ncbi:MAG: cell wall-binding repeat-containing protein, partial [Erysipelotrichaceae bacterium]|nr:cell wall-binding repeat-containing protein [Erysipelotrichaceae bacterium]